MDSNGRSYSLGAHELPSARSLGEPLTGRFNTEPGAVFLALAAGPANQRVLLASDDGYGFLTHMENLHTRQRAGKQMLNLHDGEHVMPIAVAPETEGSIVIIENYGCYLLDCCAY